MKFRLKIGSLLIVFLFLGASCYSPENTKLSPTTQADFSTPPATQEATYTPRPTGTYTPIPTSTSTPLPTKDVLAQFGIFGGDGGWEYYAFIGGDMPEWVLYTDGQLIVQKEDEHGVWFEETTLTNTQICSFLSQIESAGLFTLAFNDSFEPAYPTDYPNPIYNFDDSAQFSEGAPYYYLQVNGSKHREIRVYSHYVQYLIPDAKRIFNLFSTYSPVSNFNEYKAQYMLLRIEKGYGNFNNSNPAPTIQVWSTDLPAIGMLEEENIETKASPYFSSDVSQVLIEGEMSNQIFDAFGNRLAYQLFQSGNQVYYVVARPLLPHETLNDFSGFPQEEEFDLPFSCNN